MPATQWDSWMRNKPSKPAQSKSTGWQSSKPSRYAPKQSPAAQQPTPARQPVGSEVGTGVGRAPAAVPAQPVGGGRATTYNPANYGVPQQAPTTITPSMTPGGRPRTTTATPGQMPALPPLAGGVPQGIDLGPFQSFEQWQREFMAVHGRPPTLQGWTDASGRYHESDLDAFQDSVNFYRKTGRGPTEREWRNRYYTGAWFGNQAGGGGGGGGRSRGGGGGGGGGVPQVSPQQPTGPYEYPPGMLLWNWR